MQSTYKMQESEKTLNCALQLNLLNGHHISMQIWHRLAPLINLHTNKSCWPLLKRRIPSHFNFQQRLVRHPELAGT
jgi:hypothetical protein